MNTEKPPFNEALLEAKLEEIGWSAIVVLSMGNVFYLSAASRARSWQQSRPDAPRLVIIVWVREGDPSIIIGELEREATNESVWIKDLRCYEEYITTPVEKLIEVLKDRGFADKRIGLEMGAMGVLRYRELCEALPKATFEDCGPLMAEVRLVKTDREIARMKRGVDLMDEAYLQAFRSVRVGDSEADLHHALLDALRDRGASGARGNTLVGERAMVIHRQPTHDKKLEPSDIVRTDYTGFFEGYAAQLSRVAVVAQPTPFQKDTYSKLLAVERETAAFARSGVRALDVFHKCRAAFTERGLTHDLPLVGHCVGVDVHENPMIVPSVHTKLVENATICLEPLTLRQFHIQDQYVITPHGAELLSDKFNTDDIFVIK